MLHRHFKWFAVVGLAVLVCVAPAAYAVPVPLSTLIPGGTKTCGDKLFSDFSYSSTNNMPAASGVNVDCVTVAGNLCLEFSGGFVDLPGGDASDALIKYTVTVTAPGVFIHDAEIQGNPAVINGTGSMSITDTFLPEDESVRIMEPHLLKMWKDAEQKGKRYFPHEYFRRLFAERKIKPDPMTNENDCWAYAAYKKNIPIVIPGFEDSTMGNIFASYTYGGKYRKKNSVVLNPNIMKGGLEYFTALYDWYMEASKDSPIAFLQLGGGIAADFPICIVPSLKHDLQYHKVRDWAGFVEIGSTPMSYGSYSGAGGKEKITWDKLSTKSYYQVIQADVTVAFPWIAAVLLDL